MAVITEKPQLSIHVSVAENTQRAEVYVEVPVKEQDSQSRVHNEIYPPEEFRTTSRPFLQPVPPRRIKRHRQSQKCYYEIDSAIK